jgi:hypothetical protein
MMTSKFQIGDQVIELFKGARLQDEIRVGPYTITKVLPEKNGKAKYLASYYLLGGAQTLSETNLVPIFDKWAVKYGEVYAFNAPIKIKQKKKKATTPAAVSKSPSATEVDVARAIVAGRMSPTDFLTTGWARGTITRHEAGQAPSGRGDEEPGLMRRFCVPGGTVPRTIVPKNT